MTVTPPDVNAATGATNVTVTALSGSETLSVPVAMAKLVVSGVPVVSTIPLVMPSSETDAVAVPTTGASLVPRILMVMVEVVVKF